MKRIEIRFVERSKDYLIQRRTWWGKWKYIGYPVDLGYGTVYHLYCKDTKEELFTEVLDCHYKNDKRFIEVMEYPALKLY